MTMTEEELPSYYQPGSRLHLRLAHDKNTLTAQVIKVFTPFTMAQVILAKCNENQATMALRLPETFILKVYDPRFYSHRLPRGTRPARPWISEAERTAADIRSQQPTRAPDFEPGRQPEEEDDKAGWEEWYYQNAQAQYYSEISAYDRLKELQGSAIPRCYASASLQLTERAISPNVLILEYIPDAAPLDKVDHEALSAPLARSLLHTAGEFGRLGVIHTDLNPGNILFSPGDRPTRAVVIDFGESGIREEEDDESWAEVVEENADVLWMRKRLDRFFGADFVRGLLGSDFYVTRKEIPPILEAETRPKFTITHVDAGVTRVDGCVALGIDEFSQAIVYRLIVAAIYGEKRSARWGLGDASESLGLPKKDPTGEIRRLL